MTAYRNFIEDFPARCVDVLQEFCPPARAMDREVTLMLAVGAATLIVPFERLRQPHPSGDSEREEFTKVKKNFDSLCCRSFLESKIWPFDDPRTWQYGTVDKAQLKSDVEQWRPSNGGSHVTNQLRCWDLLYTLRNALAHGNIWDTRRPDGQIAELVFVRVPQKCQTAYFAAATPEDFGVLLKSWVKFLQDNALPKGAVAESEHFTAAA